MPVLVLMALAENAQEDAIRAGVDLTAGSVPMVRQIAAASGRPAAWPSCTSRRTPA